jgi:hypothetical protein
MGRRFLVVAACPLVPRLLVLGCSATASLAFAGNAFAKTPQLVISGPTETGASGATVVDIKEDKTDPAPLRISIYMPQGYTANFAATAGTQIGTVGATLQALVISPDATITAEGTILVGDTTSVALEAAATQCTGSPTHATIWLLHMVVAGETLDVPVFVDPTTGADAAFSAAKLVLCLPNPYEEAQPPSSRAASGAKIIDAKIALSAGVLTNPPAAGTYLWRTVVTPWMTNSPLPNAAGTIETQAVVTIPSKLSLKAKVKTVRHKRRGRTTVRNSVLLSGSLLENLMGVAGAKVMFFANAKTAGSTTTRTDGSFSRTTGLVKKTSLKATATVPTREAECVSPLPATSAPGGCVAATLAGYRISSNTALATPRKR